MQIRDIVLVGISTANSYMERAVLSLLVARRLNEALAIALVSQHFSANQRAAVEKQAVYAVDFDQFLIVEQVWQQFNRSSAVYSKSEKTYSQFLKHYGGIEPFLHPFVPFLMAKLGFQYTLFLDSDNIAISPFDLKSLAPLETHSFIAASSCSNTKFTETFSSSSCQHVNSGFIGYNNQLWLRHQGPQVWLQTMTDYITKCVEQRFCSHVYLGDGGVVLQLIRSIKMNMSSSSLSFTTIDWRFNALCRSIPCPDSTPSRQPPFFFHSTNCFPVPQCLLQRNISQQQSPTKNSTYSPAKRTRIIKKRETTVQKILQFLTEHPFPLDEWLQRTAPGVENSAAPSNKHKISSISCADLCRFEAYRQYHLACVDARTVDAHFNFRLGLES